MSMSIVSKIRLFPLLIIVAALSLSVRAFDIYSGFSLIGSAAIAEEQEAPPAEEATEHADEATKAEEARAAERQERAPIIVGLPDSEEMAIITQLRQRRETLENRAMQLDLQGQLLASTEKRIDDKILQLQALEMKIKEHLRLFDEREDGQLKAIVEVYEKMKPKDAAPRFETLDIQIQLDLVTRMKSSKVAALMEKMTPAKASDLTKELATRAAPPNIDEVKNGS